MSNISGSCLCGSVKYKSDGEPVMTAVCHCENCQKQTGTSFSVMVLVPEESFTFISNDSLGEYVDHGQSGGKVKRKFCTKCGSPIISIVENAPGLCIIKAGTLDDKSWLKPTTEFWCGSSQPWLDIGNELVKHEQNPV